MPPSETKTLSRLESIEIETRTVFKKPQSVQSQTHVGLETKTQLEYYNNTRTSTHTITNMDFMKRRESKTHVLSK